MTFSIIVPVYNIEDKVKKCLESIEKQSYKDFEVLVVIDGATDNSRTICDEFACRDGRFKVIYKKNGGLVSARKCGAKMAVGDYIINVDGDDYVDENYLLEIYNIIAEKAPDMVACAFNEVSIKIQKKKNNVPSGMYKDEALLKVKDAIVYDKKIKGFQGGALINSIWTKIVKREIYVKYQELIPDTITVGEDLILNAYLLGNIKSLYVFNESFYNYVIYDYSMMHKYNITNFKHYIDVSNELLKIEYISPNDVYVYLFQAFISEIRKVAKGNDNYSSFKKVVMNTDEISKVHILAKKAHIERYNFDFLIKYMLVKSDNCWLTYFICKKI